jgi:hypothetical protein
MHVRNPVTRQKAKDQPLPAQRLDESPEPFLVWGGLSR